MYELDRFELNWMNIYVQHDIVLMFVNDMVCDGDIVSSEKNIFVYWYR